MLPDELEGLVGYLRDLHRPVVSWLRPGVEASEIVSALGMEVPVSVIQWFGWCNGVEELPNQLQDDVEIIPRYNPVSLDEVPGLMRAHAGDRIFGDQWIPLLRSGGGDIYAAVWKPNAEAQVAWALIGESTEIEFESIDQMVTVFNGAFDGAAFFINDDGQLDKDPERYREIYRRIVGA
jgi:hypothetical protein